MTAGNVAAPTDDREFRVECLVLDPVTADAVRRQTSDGDHLVGWFDTLGGALGWAEVSIDRTGHVHRIEHGMDTVWESAVPSEICRTRQVHCRQVAPAERRRPGDGFSEALAPGCAARNRRPVTQR